MLVDGRISFWVWLDRRGEGWISEGSHRVLMGVTQVSNKSIIFVHSIVVLVLKTY